MFFTCVLHVYIGYYVMKYEGNSCEYFYDKKCRKMMDFAKIGEMSVFEIFFKKVFWVHDKNSIFCTFYFRIDFLWKKCIFVKYEICKKT